MQAARKLFALVAPAALAVSAALHAAAISALVEARALAAPSLDPPPPGPPGAAGIERVSDGEVHIDRGVLDRYLESPGELAKVRVAPDASGVRIVKVPQDSVVALLGLKDGDRIVSAGGLAMNGPEKILEIHARIRSIERLSIVVVRNGKPMTMDYVVR